MEMRFKTFKGWYLHKNFEIVMLSFSTILFLTWGWAISFSIYGVNPGVFSLGFIPILALLPKLKNQDHIHWGIFPIALAFGAVCLIRVLATPSAEGFFFVFKFFLSFIVYFIVVNRVTTIKTLSYLIGLMITLSSILLIFHIVYTLLVLQWPFLSPAFKLPGKKNTLALFLSLTFPLTCAYVISCPKKLYSWLITGITGFGLLYTISRAGLISFFLTLIAFPLFFPKKQAAWIFSGSIFTIFIVLNLLFGIGYHTFSELKFQGSVLSPNNPPYAANRPIISLHEERFELIKNGISGWKQNPIFGNGYGSFVKINGREVHNEYIRILSEFGLVGMIFFIALLGYIARDIFIVWKSSSDQWTAMGIIISIICLILWLNTVTIISSMFVWFILACLTIAKISTQSHADSLNFSKK